MHYLNFLSLHISLVLHSDKSCQKQLFFITKLYHFLLNISLFSFLSYLCSKLWIFYWTRENKIISFIDFLWIMLEKKWNLCSTKEGVSHGSSVLNWCTLRKNESLKSEVVYLSSFKKDLLNFSAMQTPKLHKMLFLTKACVSNPRLYDCKI